MGSERELPVPDLPSLPAETLQRLLELSSEVVMVATEDWRIVYVNPACVASLGYPAGELVGRQLPDLFDPGDREAVLAGMAMALRLGVAGSPAERRLRRRDGSAMVGVGHCFRTVLDGRPALVLIVRDHTDRSHLEEKHRKSELDFQSLVEGHPGLMAVHVGGRLRYINRAGARMLGYSSPEKLIGCSVLTLVPEDARRPLEVRLETYVLGGSDAVAPRLVKVFRADGQVRTFEVATLLTHFDGQPADLVVAHDETDRLEAESRLARSSAALRRAEAMSAVGRLVSAVAHEVRNPLFAITSTLDSLLAALPEDPFARKCGAILHEEVSRLTDLMRDLLEYGKPREPRFVADALEEVVERVVAAGAAAAQARAVQVVHRLGGGLPRVWMDPGRMVQVFQNVIDNAVRHAPAGSEIAVTGELARRSDGEWIVYRVRDRGPGFREEDLPRIFEPFFSRRYGGTGLGLSIVQQICEEHGGFAEVANLPEGGACVTVRFPAHDAEGQPS